MYKSFKEAIPKSHYEIALDMIQTYLGGFGKYVNKIESLCGINPGIFEFSRNLENMSTGSLLNDTEEQKALHNNVMFHMYNMWQCGKPIYYITPQLAINLAQTDLNVDTEFLLSPFYEIYVQIDSNLFKISDEKGEHPVKGFYVYFNRYDSGMIELRIMATAIIDANKEVLDDTNFYFKLLLKPGKIKNSLKDYLSGIVSPKNKNELIRFGGLNNVGHIEEFTCFVVNVLLYLTSKNPDIIEKLPVNFEEEQKRIKSPKKLKKFLRGKNKFSSYPIMIVGPNIKIDNQKIESIRRNGSIHQWKLNHKVRVSSHWRVQWYGSEKNNNRRWERIRIESYVKGPDTADTFLKKRVVK